jgi:hypothetical protein
MTEPVPSVPELLAEFEKTLDKLELADNDLELRRRFQQLVDSGCDEKFLLSTSSSGVTSKPAIEGHFKGSSAILVEWSWRPRGMGLHTRERQHAGPQE